MKRLTLIALALAMTASCTVTSSPAGPSGPSEPPPPPPEEHGRRHEHRQDAAPPVPGSDPAPSAGVSGRIRVRWRLDRGWAPAVQKDWVEVGKARVAPGSTDQHMEGHIGRQTWGALALRMEGNNAVDVYDVVLELANGNAYVPEIKHTFRDGERTVIIDLPKSAELIRSLTFRYGSVTQGGSTFVVYGLPNK